MPATLYTTNHILDHLLRGKAFAAPTKLFISLHAGDPGNTGQNEVTTAQWPAYQRIDTAAGGAMESGFSAPQSGESRNLKQLLWPSYNGQQPLTVTHFALWDRDKSGNCLWQGALSLPKTLAPSDEIVLHASQMQLMIE